jgi:hypothetical protein
MRIARIVAVFLVLAAVGRALELRGQDAKAGDRYTMSVKALVVDSCDVICPCLFGNEPTHGHCRFVAALKIESGALGDVKLDGVRWAMLGEFKGETRKGPTWGYHAFYLDEGATAEQKTALKKILGAPPFSTLGKLLGVDVVKIEMTVGERLEPWKVTIGDKGSFTAEPVAGGDPTKPQAIENPVYPFPAEKVIFAKASGKFVDHGKELALEANSGEISTFTLEGSVPAGTSPIGMSDGGE